MERRHLMGATFQRRGISFGHGSIPPCGDPPPKPGSKETDLLSHNKLAASQRPGSHWVRWPPGKLTMSIMNSRIATKSVLMLGAAAGMMMASAAAMARSSGGYTFTDIRAPGATWTEAYGINDAGQIVGQDSNGSFLDTNGTFTTVSVPGSASPTGGVTGTWAYGVNNGGQIVGYYNDTYGYSHGFLDTDGTYTTFGGVPLGTSNAYAYGINDAGQIVGTKSTAGPTSGFLYQNGTFTTISVSPTITWANGINNSGQIVGTDQTGSNNGSFLDANGTYTTVSYPLGEGATYARDINDLGQIVGVYVNSAVNGFVDTSGTFTTVNDPIGTGGTWAQGINNAGDIVGFYTAASGETHGFLATPDGIGTDGAPLPVTGGTLPGAMALLGWLGRRLVRRRPAIATIALT